MPQRSGPCIRRSPRGSCGLRWRGSVPADTSGSTTWNGVADPRAAAGGIGAEPAWSAGEADRGTDRAPAEPPGQLRRTLFGFRCLYLVRSCSSRRDGQFRPSSGRLCRAGVERSAATRARPGCGPSRSARGALRTGASRSPQRAVPAPGDRLRPAGMRRAPEEAAGFVRGSAKLLGKQRDAVPLVVDREDRILWVVGDAVAEDFRVTEPSQGVLLLKARRLGGLG